VIVLDASLALEIILKGTEISALAQQFSELNEQIYAPELIDVEVANALRKQINLRRISVENADRAMRLFLELPIIRKSHFSLLPRIWQLKDNFKPYDAAYIALAEELNAELWTCDRKFGGPPLHAVRVIVRSPAP
jgi:predicted nucleic acid-binding protein